MKLTELREQVGETTEWGELDGEILNQIGGGKIVVSAGFTKATEFFKISWEKS
jgi:hypothetical protein